MFPLSSRLSSRSSSRTMFFLSTVHERCLLKPKSSFPVASLGVDSSFSFLSSTGSSKVTVLFLLDFWRCLTTLLNCWPKLSFSAFSVTWAELSSALNFVYVIMPPDSWPNLVLTVFWSGLSIPDGFPAEMKLWLFALLNYVALVSPVRVSPGISRPNSWLILLRKPLAILSAYFFISISLFSLSLFLAATWYDEPPLNWLWFYCPREFAPAMSSLNSELVSIKLSKLLMLQFEAIS